MCCNIYVRIHSRTSAITSSKNFNCQLKKNAHSMHHWTDFIQINYLVHSISLLWYILETVHCIIRIGRKCNCVYMCVMFYWKCVFYHILLFHRLIDTFPVFLEKEELDVPGLGDLVKGSMPKSITLCHVVDTFKKIVKSEAAKRSKS